MMMRGRMMVRCASSGQLQKKLEHMKANNDYYDEEKGTRQILLFR